MSDRPEWSWLIGTSKANTATDSRNDCSYPASDLQGGECHEASTNNSDSADKSNKSDLIQSDVIALSDELF